MVKRSPKAGGRGPCFFVGGFQLVGSASAAHLDLERPRITFECDAFNKHFNVRAANQHIAYELLPSRNFELLLDYQKT